MARRPKPWFWKARNRWFVTVDRERHDLGPEKGDAYERFYALMRQPKHQRVASESLAAIIDVFLEWVSKNRSPETYEGVR